LGRECPRYSGGTAVCYHKHHVVPGRDTPGRSSNGRREIFCFKGRA
jgi:hypothetical protein